MKKPIKCILFDCDGVLVDSEPIALSTLVYQANQLGVDIDLDFAIQYFKGHSLEEVIATLAYFRKNPIPTNFEQTYRTITFDRFKKELKSIAGIAELIPQLKIPYAVASSGPQHKIRLNLEITGLIEYFEGNIFSCYDLQKWKPDPAIYIHAATQMGFEPSECLIIEDSLMGVQAAVASGAVVYAYAEHAHDKEELQATGATLFYDMGDILELLFKNTFR